MSKLPKSSISVSAASTMSTLTEPSTVATSSGGGSATPSNRPPLLRTISDDSLDDAANSPSRGTPTGVGGAGGGGKGGGNGPVPLSFPNVGGGGGGKGGGSSASTSLDPTSCLGPLNDERSKYASVARSCLCLNQYAGSGSQMEGNSFGGRYIISSALFHDKTYASIVSSALSSLSSCATSHTDRRCRILSLKTLSTFARSAYGRLRHSHLLFSTREGMNVLSTIEDQVVNDVSSTLIMVGLEDDDDGVSSIAFECLGCLILDSTADLLRDEIRRIACCAPNHHHHEGEEEKSDDDFKVAMSELRTRILSRAIPPRIRRILHRITLYRSTSHTSRTLSFVTEAIAHMVSTSPSTSGTINRAAYAKRWYESDTENLAKELVEGVLLPCMVDRWDGFGGGEECKGGGGAGHVAAMAILKISHACPSASWVNRACACAVESLLEVLYQMSNDENNNYGSAEGKAAILACILIALRGVPMEDGEGGGSGLWEGFGGSWGECILYVIDELRTLPCTVPIPSGIVSAGLVLEDEDQYETSNFLPGCVRQPIRIGLWSEVALALFLEGSSPMTVGNIGNAHSTNHVGNDSSSSTRLEILHYIVTGEIVSSILADRSGSGKNKKKIGDGKRSGSVGAKIGSGGGGGIGENLDLDGQFFGAGPAEELVLSFCSVASIIGQTLLRHVTPGRSSVDSSRQTSPTVVDYEAEEWLRCALVLLSTFSPCVNWRSGGDSSLVDSSSTMESEARLASNEEEEDISFASHFPRWTVCSAARTAYLTLLQQCLHCTGLLNPVSSVSLRLTSPYSDASFGSVGAVPPTQATSSAAGATLAPPLSNHTFAQKDLSALAEQLVEYKLREGIPSRSVRIHLLALLSDHWIQRCQIEALSPDQQKSSSAGDNTDSAKEDYMRASQVNMNEMNAREILSMLTAEISALIEAEERVNSPRTGNGRDAITSTVAGAIGNMAYLQVCIACIECIALTAYELGRRLGQKPGEDLSVTELQDDGIQQSASSLRAEIDEDSSYILNVCLAALNGQKKKRSKSKESHEASASQSNNDDSEQTGASDEGEIASTAMIVMVSECLDAAKRIQTVIDSEPSTEKTVLARNAVSSFGGKVPTSIIVGSPNAGDRLAWSPLLSNIIAGGWMSIVCGNSPPTGQNNRRPFSPSITSPRDAGARTREGHDVNKAQNEWISTSPFKDMTVDAYDRAYMFQYYRQVVLARCDMAILSSSLACLDVGRPRFAANHRPGTPRNEGDGASTRATLVSARPRNALRLTPPLLPPLRSTKTPLSCVESSYWSDSVTSVSGASDPVALTLAHAVKSCPRYDGEIERRLVVTMRIYNVTAVPITNGVRLDLSIKHSSDDLGANAALEEGKLPTDLGGMERCTTHQLTSTTAVYKAEIKPGDHLTWEVTLGIFPVGRIQLRASVTFREMETETSTHRWIGIPASSRVTAGSAVLSDVSEGNEDLADDKSKEDFSAEQESSGGAPFGSVEDTADDEDETTDMTLFGEDVTISPFVMLQPCPLVFFLDNSGDQNSFWFLWFSMLSPVEELKLISRNPSITTEDNDDPILSMAARCISDRSLLTLQSQGNKNGALKGWAFMTSCGRRILCLLTKTTSRLHSEEDEDEEVATFRVKSDDFDLITALVGSSSARHHFVSNITGGAFTLCHNT